MADIPSTTVRPSPWMGLELGGTLTSLSRDSTVSRPLGPRGNGPLGAAGPSGLVAGAPRPQSGRWRPAIAARFNCGSFRGATVRTVGELLLLFRTCCHSLRRWRNELFSSRSPQNWTAGNEKHILVSPHPSVLQTRICTLLEVIFILSLTIVS